MPETVTESEQHLYRDLVARGGEALLGDVTESVARALGRSPEQVQPLLMVAALEGERKGFLVMESRERLELSLRAPELAGRALPERTALRLVGERAGDKLLATELAERCAAAGVALNDVMRWGVRRGWFEPVKEDARDERGKPLRSLALTAAGEAALAAEAADERLLRLLGEQHKVYFQDLANLGFAPDPAILLLLERIDLVRKKERTERRVRLTPSGQAFAAESRQVRQSVNRYGKAEIEDWARIDFRPYDVTLAAGAVFPAKCHPLQRIIAEVRQAFLELGFEETRSPMVESAFWDFDALFQPQDHPAREMQDTFYLSAPASARLPPAAVVEKVTRTHEDGGGTGSTGWGYRWDPARASQVVLRTHTTASTIRAVAQDPRPPRKVFTVGRVFRNETISQTKLPEFHQVDGIIIDEKASLATLLGTLKVFYAKMGFERVRFKPAFFPYTEPSAEVYVWFERLGRWIEMGGSGVFRPEVTRPQGCTVPVLAWGLGLERLAMFRLGLTDIRALYQVDLDWLKGVPLCL